MDVFIEVAFAKELSVLYRTLCGTDFHFVYAGVEQDDVSAGLTGKKKDKALRAATRKKLMGTLCLMINDVKEHFQVAAFHTAVFA